MRYRIKIKTFKSNRQEFTAQVKALIGWNGLDFDGARSCINLPSDNRSEALRRIDRHVAGNCKTDTVKIEYITR